LSSYRRIGYDILPGRAFDYILHLRPLEWPVVAAHLLAGFLVAAGVSGNSVHAGSLVPAFFAWVLLLNAGTLALNSHFDKDDGDIGYLADPPEAPKYLGQVGGMLMLAGLVPAYLVSSKFAIAYAVCLLMSFVYSCPPFRLKAVAGADLIINAVGFGGLTFLAGSLAFSSVLNTESIILAFGFSFLFAGFYPLTQLYQYDEDSRKGDRTLVVAMGKKRGLGIAIAGTAVAFVIFFVGVTWSGPSALSLVLAIPVAAWAYLLIPWFISVEEASYETNRRGMYRALWIWALTDITLVGWALAGGI
jgi:4-hydroxybenzoate polyprenyltransferase